MLNLLFLKHSTKNKILVVIFLYLSYLLLNVNTELIFLYEPIFSKLVYLLNDSNKSLILIYVLYIYISKTSNYILTLLMLTLSNISSNYLDFIFLSKSYNTTLINGLVLIHPIFIYLGSINLYTLYHTKHINSKAIYLYSYCALILGCWWAQQEANWGGWWNWDPIELLSLFLFLFSLIIIHFKMNYFKKKIYFKYINLLVIFMYLLSRHDLLNSIHSFTNVLNNNYKEYVLFIIILIFFIKCSLLYKLCVVNDSVLSYVNAALMVIIYYVIFNSMFFDKSVVLSYKNAIIACFLFCFFIKNIKFLFINSSCYLEFSIVTYYFWFFKNTSISHLMLIFFIVLLSLNSNSYCYFLENNSINHYDSIDNAVISINTFWNYKIHNNVKIFFNHTLDVNFKPVSRFFIQSLKTNFIFNKNCISLNKFIIIFQKYLYVCLCFITINIIYLYKKNFFFLKQVV